MNELGKKIVKELRQDITQEQEDLVNSVKKYLNENYTEVIAHASEEHSDQLLNTFLIDKAKTILGGKNGKVHEKIIYALAVEFYTTPIKELKKQTKEINIQTKDKETKRETSKKDIKNEVKKDDRQLTFDFKGL